MQRRASGGSNRRGAVVEVVERRPAGSRVTDGWLGFLVTDEAAGVVKRVGIGDTGQEELRPVVVEHGRCPCTVATLDLCQVLPDRDDLNPVRRAGRRQPVELGERGDVGRLVEHHQEGRVQRTTRFRGHGERTRQHRLCQRGEVPAQAALVMGGRAEVQRVRAVQKMVRLEGADRRWPGRRVGERGEHRLGRGVDGAAGPFVATPGRLRRMEDLGRGGALEDRRHFADFLRVHPADHVGHGATVQRRRDEQRGQELGCGGVPELPVGGRARTPRRLTQLGGGPAGLTPLPAARER